MRAPGFTATAVLTLALGLGANTAIFSLVNALLLRPLPAPHAEQLAVLKLDEGYGPNWTFCEPLFRGLEKRHEAFQDVAAFTGHDFLVRSGSGVVKVNSALVSGEFFSAMETAPLLGRVLTPEDDRPGGPSGGFGVVISEGFWKTWFNSAPDVVGRKLVIADVPFTVVGVMPKRFIGADATERPEIYAPLWAEPVIDAPYNNLAAGYHAWWLQIIARRKPGVTLEQANAALAAASNPVLEAATSDTKWIKDEQAHHFRIEAEAGAAGYSGLRNPYYNFVQSLKVVMVLCAAMLLLACLNSDQPADGAGRGAGAGAGDAAGDGGDAAAADTAIDDGERADRGDGNGGRNAGGTDGEPGAGRGAAGAFPQRCAGHDAGPAGVRICGWDGDRGGAADRAGAGAAGYGEKPERADQTGDACGRRGRTEKPAAARADGPGGGAGAGAGGGSGVAGYEPGAAVCTGWASIPKGLVNLELDMSKQALDGEALTRWYRAYGEALSHLPGVQGVTFQSVTPLGGVPGRINSNLR